MHSILSRGPRRTCGAHSLGRDRLGGLALNPAFAVFRARALWAAMSDDPTYLVQLEPILEGLRKAGVPEVSSKFEGGLQGAGAMLMAFG